MSGKLTKKSRYVLAYYNADENTRRRIKTRIDKYLSKANVSQDMLAKEFTSLLGIGYQRKPAAGLVEFLGYPKKDKNLIDSAKREAGNVSGERSARDKLKVLLTRLEDKHISKSKFTKIWRDLSFKEIKDKYNFSQYESSIIAKHYNLGVKMNKQYEYTYLDMYSDLIKKGETDSSIKKLYIDDLMTVNEIIEIYKNILGSELITAKRIEKMMSMLGLYRSTSDVKNLQGKMSRRIKADNLARLALSGYTLSTLANKYEEDLTLTKRALLKEINAPLEGTVSDEFKFTDRWLARHIDPLLTKVRLGSVSRSELEFTKVLQENLNGEELRTSVRDLIPPQEVDLYFPELKLAIEFNGDYWHSDKFMEENHQCSAKAYHEDKVNRCASLGVKLIFVWESDWVDYDEVVLSAIKDLIYNKKDTPIINKLESPFDLD